MPGFFLPEIHSENEAENGVRGKIQYCIYTLTPIGFAQISVEQDQDNAQGKDT